MRWGKSTMNTSYKLLSVILVGLMAMTGFAAATGSVGVADAKAVGNENGFDMVDGSGPINASDGERNFNRSNNPWSTGDERLDRFQERFDLTEEQVQSIQVEVQSMLNEDASREDIRHTVRSMLSNFGVEDPALGRPSDGAQSKRAIRQANGYRVGQGYSYAHGHGVGNGTDQHGPTVGSEHRSGPHGPADGSCLE